MASSRGISNILVITREIVKQVKNSGGEPFVIPAIGRNEEGKAEGQKGILTGYGITEGELDVQLFQTIITETKEKKQLTIVG